MKTFIIAEIGVNHNGSIKIAKKLIMAAKKYGANAVKFQSYISNELVSKSAELAIYQRKGIKKNSMLLLLKKYELSQKNQLLLFKFCKKIKIEFLSSAFDLNSLNFLTDKLKLKKLKVPSGEITNFPYLVELAKKGKKVILSTGMASLKEIKQAIKILNTNGLSKKKITILHCNTAYPTPMKDVNLKSIDFLKKKLKTEIGYSDHSPGIEVAIAAVALGASVIEKHLTLSRNLIGPDHLSSILPSELKHMISSIRNIEIALGDENKPVTSSERKNIKYVRKSIVAKIEIFKGEKFKTSNISTKRPGNGISPLLWNKVLKLKAKKNFKPDELIKI